LINKKVPDEKYQFHFQTEQYMDSRDSAINALMYDKFPEKVLDKLVELAKKNNAAIEFIINFTYNRFEKYKNIYTKEYDEYKLGLALRSLDYSINSNDLFKQIKELIEKGANIHTIREYALRHVAYYGHLEIVKYLVEKGANIHALGDAPLRWSAENGHLEIVKYLVENGADIHVNNDYALKNSSVRVKNYLQSIIDKRNNENNK
jgi:rRNA-processing protein FCF1